MCAYANDSACRFVKYNFVCENHTKTSYMKILKNQDTLKEQSILQIIRKYFNSLYAIFRNRNKVN